MKTQQMCIQMLINQKQDYFYQFLSIVYDLLPHRFINKMLKNSILIILVCFLSLCLNQSTPVILGGFKAMGSIDNEQFEDVLAFVSTQHPQVADYTLISVQSQSVAGTNYILTLQSPQGCDTNVKVGVSLQGNMQILQFNPASCQSNIGSYAIQLTPSGYQYQSALTEALTQNPQYFRSSLVLTETQFISGTNYRFTFRDPDSGYLKQVVIFVPLQPISTLSPQNLSSIELIGGFQDIRNDPAAYEIPISSIYENNPQVQGYKIVGVQRQITAGTTYRVGLQNNTLTSLSYTSYQVYIDLSGAVIVTQTSWINIVGYTVQKINLGCADSLQVHSQIVDFPIIKITNIWPNEGLMITYFKDEQQYEVFIYMSNGITQNIIS